MNSPNEIAAPREFRLRQGERLRLRTLVEQLFANGKSLYEWPLRAVYRPLDAETLDAMFKGHVPPSTGRLQMLITVPKKKRRHAVDRVRMRRRIREAWRLNRAPLRTMTNRLPQIRTFSIAFIYLADHNVDYAKVEQSMQTLINLLTRKLEKATHADTKCENCSPNC